MVTMCVDEDDEVFECDDSAAGGNDESSKRRSQSLSSLQAAGPGEKVIVLYPSTLLSRFCV